MMLLNSESPRCDCIIWFSVLKPPTARFPTFLFIPKSLFASLTTECHLSEGFYGNTMNVGLLTVLNLAYKLFGVV